METTITKAQANNPQGTVAAIQPLITMDSAYIKPPRPDRLAVRLTYPDGMVAHLSHRNATAWCPHTAQKHAKDFAAKPENKHIKVELIEA